MIVGWGISEGGEGRTKGVTLLNNTREIVGTDRISKNRDTRET